VERGRQSGVTLLTSRRAGSLRHPAAVLLIAALGMALAACASAAASPSVLGGSPASATAAPPVGSVGPAAASALPQGSVLATAAPTPPRPQATPTPPPVPATPRPPTADANVVRSLDNALEQERRRRRIPGISATILFSDGTSWTGVAGEADVRAGTPVEPDTAFSIASISKTFVAALVLDLSADGRLRLDDPVAKLLPGRKAPPGVTVRMLLDHTSGLHDFFFDRRIDRALQGDPSRAWTSDQALRYVGKPYFPPGTGWHYSNTNYLLLGLIAERVTGRDLADELRDRFLEPLGLETAFYQAAEKARGPLAHGYRLTGSGASTRAVDLSDGTGVVPFRSVVTAADAAGAIAASSMDVARWARALYTGQAIDAESVSLMLSGVAHVAPYRPRVPYGLGVQAVVVDDWLTFGHSGRFLGFRSVMRWLPTEEVAIAVLTNQSREDPGAIAARLLRIALPPPGPVPASRPH
jgi:D-alanyl-D-alanine carboxypeptidase